jgi:hypothetical protein
VMVTAIQLSLREKCNPKLRISYDSASPFQTDLAPEKRTP